VDDVARDLVARRTGDVAVEHRDVVRVDAQEFQRGVAVARDVGGDRLESQPVAYRLREERLVLHHQHTHALDGTSRGISSASQEPGTPSQRAPPCAGCMTRQTPVSRSISRWARAAVAVVVLRAAAAVWASSEAPAASGPTMSDDATVAGLDPALQDAIRDAITDAAADGVEIRITSGWRSPEEQERLWREAVAEYGSEAEAARWVAPVDASAHVTG